MGNVKAGLAQASHTVSATYTTPYVLNASLGPNISIADVTPTGVTLYNKGSGFGLTNVNAQVAEALGVSPSSVRGIAYPSSSSYGTSTETDSPIAAAVLSQAVGKPVRLQFMRWDDAGYGLMEPAEVVKIQAGIDAKGNITAFDYLGISTRIVNTGAITTGGIYKIPNRNVVIRPYERYFPGVSFRSVSDRAPLFATEQTIDELAHLAGMDPIDFRRQNMPGNVYWLEVLNAAAAAAKWQPRVANSHKPTGNVVAGRGIAIGGFANSYVGVVAEIEVNKKTGKIVAKHLYAAQDVGLAVNPALVENQMVGSLMQGTSRALLESVVTNKERITSLDWASYPSLRFKDAPNITTIVVNRPDQPSSGAGEPSLAPVAAAISNALFDATGVRMRQAPMTPGRVRAALKSGA
jgi:CO/xanthine dehydrogenase Mo-binding subunit